MAGTRLARMVILGPPGSGKGTIAERITRDFLMTHISCGDLLRTQIRHETYLGREAQKYIRRGELIPDDLVTRMMVSELTHAPLDHCSLIDGFPRTVVQAKSLQSQFPVDAVVELAVPHHVIIDRVKDRWIHEPSGRIYNLSFNPPKMEGKDDITGEPLTQREDDKPETVKKRLENFSKWERPVAQFFKDLGLLQQFQGEETNAIWPNVFHFLCEFLEPLQRTVYR